MAGAIKGAAFFPAAVELQLVEFCHQQLTYCFDALEIHRAAVDVHQLSQQCNGLRVVVINLDHNALLQLRRRYIRRCPMARFGLQAGQRQNAHEQEES